MIGSTEPSSHVTVPVTWVTRRRMPRTRVERGRCARLSAKAKSAPNSAARLIVPDAAKNPVRTGNEPQESANHQSVWKRLSKSSRLYASTRKEPTTTNAAIHGSTTAAPSNPDSDRERERGSTQGDEHRVGYLRLQRPTLELVERVCADADGEEEGRQGREQAGEREGGGEGSSDRDEGEMPGRIGKMEERDVVAQPPEASA